MAKAKKKESLTPEERLQAALVSESEQPYPVPANWCWVHLLDSFYNCTDSKKKIPQKEYIEDGKIAVVDQGQNLVGGYTNDREMAFSGNLPVIIFGDHTRCIKYIDFPFAQGADGVKVLNPKPFFDAKAFYYAFQNINIPNLGYRRHFPLFDQYTIPLPPFAEQQRIVDRIESLFAKLDEAKQKAQDALGGFETRKAAILHKAFTGELTAKWRKEHGVGMETWSSCKLIDILVEKPRNGYSPKPVDYVTACKSMTLSATTTGVFKPEFFKYIDEEIPENSHLWLTPGDILIQRANSLEKVGMSAIYTGAEHEFIYPDLMMKLTVKEPNNKHYIDYYLKTDEILNYFRSNATGTAGNMPKINQKVVSETPLILPETQEQAEIVRLLDDLLAREQQAKEAAEGVLEQIDLMKKAILARAFRGELGTNDPREESAVELLKQVL